MMKVNRVTTFLVVGLTALATACASTKTTKEQKEDASGRVSLVEMTAPARAAAERLTAGGKIEKIDKETEKGKTVYDVEANVGGKHMEYTITTDGAIVGTETGIDFKDLPEAVQAATEKYFGRTTNLEQARVVEEGKTAYEIEGKKDGKKVAVTFDETGKLVEEEK